MLGNAIAPPVFGYLIQQVGVQTTFFAITGVALGATVVTLLVVVTFVGEPRPAPVTDG
jgi:fucose permease